ncbi:unnamed protein product [Amoebophrya sp. A25]|nr:unnamed protein product [Amoebophrya sp. A25]|eukprot:GSA25T00026096001.1
MGQIAGKLRSIRSNTAKVNEPSSDEFSPKEWGKDTWEEFWNSPFGQNFDDLVEGIGLKIYDLTEAMQRGEDHPSQDSTKSTMKSATRLLLNCFAQYKEHVLHSDREEIIDVFVDMARVEIQPYRSTERWNASVVKDFVRRFFDSTTRTMPELYKEILKAVDVNAVSVSAGDVNAVSVSAGDGGVGDGKLAINRVSAKDPRMRATFYPQSEIDRIGKESEGSERGVKVFRYFAIKEKEDFLEEHWDLVKEFAEKEKWGAPLSSPDNKGASSLGQITPDTAYDEAARIDAAERSASATTSSATLSTMHFEAMAVMQITTATFIASLVLGWCLRRRCERRGPRNDAPARPKDEGTSEEEEEDCDPEEF